MGVVAQYDNQYSVFRWDMVAQGEGAFLVGVVALWEFVGVKVTAEWEAFQVGIFAEREAFQ